MEKSDALLHAYGAEHYKAFEIEPIDFIALNGFGFIEGNIIKYVSRWRLKNGYDDLKKALTYLERLIELKDTLSSEQEKMIIPPTEYIVRNKIAGHEGMIILHIAHWKQDHAHLLRAKTSLEMLIGQ